MLLAFLSFSAARAQCYAGFVYYNAPGSTTVNFYDSSMVTLGSITGYSWDFGDNSNGTGANPVHSYNSVGTYGVMLTITTSTGCNSTYYDTVWVGVPQCNMYAYISHAQLVQTLTANVVGGTPPYTYNYTLHCKRAGSTIVYELDPN